MRYIDIKSGDQSIKVSRLALGTFGYGKLVSTETSWKLMDQYAEAGGNCYDCARVYMGGICEEAVGGWIKDRKNRHEILISTKGGHPPQNDMSVGRLSLKDLQYDLEQSLLALNTDYVDFFWLHKDDRSRPVEAIVEDVNTLLKSGKVRVVGCSNWHTDRIEQANKYAAENGLTGFGLSQIQWSLAQADSTQSSFTDHLDVVMTPSEYEWYRRNNMTVFAWGSQAHAVFTKADASGWDSISENTLREFGSEGNRQTLANVRAFCLENGLPISAVSLAYVTCNRVPGVALIGCKNQDQLSDSLRAADVLLGAERLESLRVI